MLEPRRDDVRSSLELAVFLRDRLDSHPLAPGAELLIGRGPACAAVVDDNSVSREHAALRFDGDRVFVRDLGSANGTYVRDLGSGSGGTTHRMRAVTGEIAVPIGSILHFGAVMGVVRKRSESPVTGDGVIVREPSMRALYDQAGRAAGALISVLLLGETGVGKEVLARNIHARSPRASRPFLALSCAALPATLLESELFGHEKGSFTGAQGPRLGLVEAASGGTLFLDEIGELPMEIQVKLLRVIEERMVLPIGARAPRPVDVRFVAATNRDLEAECARGAFRTDLFFRLNGIALTIPPLRQRTGEIEELSRSFLAAARLTMNEASARDISAEALADLRRYSWPGNVRELRNVIERAVVLCAGDTILAEHLPEKVRAASPSKPPGLHDEIAALERAKVLEALERCGGNQTRAAEHLGISRRTLVSRLSEYGLTKPRRRE